METNWAMMTKITYDKNPFYIPVFVVLVVELVDLLRLVKMGGLGIRAAAVAGDI